MTQESAVLVLLDLSAAFDTVDHSILLSRLENWVGIKGTALRWFQSYLTDRSFSVHLGDYSSETAPFTCGVPQGSVLGPILFSLYMLPLASIFERYDVSFHCFADDIQIYLPLNVKKKGPLQPRFDCMKDIKTWMNLNFLNLNGDKTEIIVFGHPELLDVDYLGPLTSNSRSTVRSLGVVLDGAFKLDKQISATVRSCFFQLRTIAKVKAYLPPKDLERVINALITSRLDYCNSLYVGLDKSLIQRLQLVQNAAARLLTGKRKRDHITPVLRYLHLLPVHYRIDFKI